MVIELGSKTSLTTPSSLLSWPCLIGVWRSNEEMDMWELCQVLVKVLMLFFQDINDNQSKIVSGYLVERPREPFVFAVHKLMIFFLCHCPRIPVGESQACITHLLGSSGECAGMLESPPKGISGRLPRMWGVQGPAADAILDSCELHRLVRCLCHAGKEILYSRIGKGVCRKNKPK